MKLTEPNEPHNNELIAHIRERLMEHEEEYVPGAWEKFSTPEKKKRPLVWLSFLSGAAAILIIGFMTFLLTHKTPKETTIELTKIKEIPKIEDKSLENSNSKQDFVKSHQPKNTNVTRENHKNLSVKEVFLNIDKDILVKRINENEVVMAKNQSNANNEIISKVQTAITPIKESTQKEESIVTSPKDIQPKQTNIIAFLEGETKKNQVENKSDIIAKKDNKLTIGVVVSPSFGNVKKLNMGYGVSLDYSLSDKFSLNSGIAYNQMSAAKDAFVSNGAMNSPTTSSIIREAKTKNLESVEEKISGIDIPLELKYNFSKNVYANIGVSAFAVISQKRNNTFIENRVEQRLQSLTNGTQQLSSVLVSDRVTEEVNPAKAEDYSYLGFYNFSFGYKKKISKNNAFAIEPFVKLPMKQVSTTNLRLIGTGVKLKFDF